MIRGKQIRLIKEQIERFQWLRYSSIDRQDKNNEKYQEGVIKGLEMALAICLEDDDND